MLHPSLTDPEPVRDSEVLLELPIQPSSLPSSARGSRESTTPNAEPIPANELSAASPLRNDREQNSRRAANRLWWPVALAVVVLAGLAVIGAIKNGSDRGVRGPADEAAPDAPSLEKVPATSPNAR